MLYGHRDFVCLIGSDEGHAMDMLESIKTELDGNDLLLEDFPEVVLSDPVPRRHRQSLLAASSIRAQRTHIGWTAKEIVLPTIADSRASGAIIKVAGITGRIRGMKYKRPDGRSARPSLVVIDDPQTDESARSLSQCATRESILAGAVLGLAGPGKKIAGIMPCTVIRPGDMADNILDRDKHPEWNGERTKMVYSFPSQRKALATVCRDPRREPTGRTWTCRRHGVLPPEPGGDGRGGGGRLAGAIQPRRTLGHPTCHELEAAGRSGPFGRSIRTNHCRRRPRRKTISPPTRSLENSTACAGARCRSAATT